jgi:luciferase family oxidoreductase group 1
LLPRPEDGSEGTGARLECSMSSPLLYSFLDLAPIRIGHTAADAFREAAELAQLAESLGYTRYWLAEHHNIPGVASAATSVVIGHVAAHTKSIRVGAGGIMLPNHAPLVIAEQFGTLESLYPGRIDLGLGRAPGGDQRTARALRRHHGPATGDAFPEEMAELRAYLSTPQPGQTVHAVPGEGLNIPIYLLGSSDFSARLAAKEGLPFAFASHFAPDYLLDALALYRGGFHPSAQLKKPHVMLGVNTFLADTDAEAKRLFTSLQQAFLGIIRGARSQLAPPVDAIDWLPHEESHVSHMLRCSVVGSPVTARAQLDELLAQTKADEIVATAQIYDVAARRRSLELFADAVMARNSHQRAA